MIIRNTIFSIDPPATHNVLWIKAGANNINTLYIYDSGWRKIGISTGGGSSDYNDLENKPSINGVTLSGNLTTEQLKIIIPELSKYLTRDDLNSTLTEYAKKSDIPNLDNILTKDIADKLYQPVGEYATKQELSDKADITYVDSGLSQKQDKGNYALKTDLNNLATKTELNTKADSSALDSLATKKELETKANASELSKYATVEALNEKPSLEQVNSSIDTKIGAQEFKTINGNSILGNGDITISGGGSVVVDQELNPESENAISNKAVAALLLKLDEKVFPITFNVSGGGTFDEGTTQVITVTWKLQKDGQKLTPESVTVNAEQVDVSTNYKVFTEVTTTTTYNVVATYKGKQYKGSTTATFKKTYYRYHGAAPLDTDFNNLSDEVIKSFTKTPTTSKEADNVSYYIPVEGICTYIYPTRFGKLTQVQDNTAGGAPSNNWVISVPNLTPEPVTTKTINGEECYIYRSTQPNYENTFKYNFK